MHMRPTARRIGKALVVTVIASALSHLLLSDGLSLSQWQQAATNVGGDLGGSGDTAFSAAVVNTMLAMPAVLWVGMRLLRERRVYLIVAVGTVGWFFTVGHYIDQLSDRPSTVMPLGPLALFIAVTVLSSVLLRPQERVNPGSLSSTSARPVEERVIGSVGREVA
ncbi:hypothetical protein [Streptomyces atratus]|uniref:hypothetical protein n=1 Tax=Streptomyces atratus TaxID=1893 RepID=UPI001300341E|nr:hypothetical protein [Streptomyces atratus]